MRLETFGLTAGLLGNGTLWACLAISTADWQSPFPALLVSGVSFICAGIAVGFAANNNKGE